MQTKPFHQEYRHSFPRRLLAAIPALLTILTCLTGCQTSQPIGAAQQQVNPSEAIILREGDVLKVSFPGAPSLDTTQPIRRDGKIVLSLVGEVRAEGRTPAELEKELVQLYANQLVSKEVLVTVTSSAFPVFVSGAVIRPGKITSNRPITVLEAVMEAGGFDLSKANTAAVRVIRNEGGQVRNFTVNLKGALQGKPSSPFYVKPSDIVFVPEKFRWF